MLSRKGISMTGFQPFLIEVIVNQNEPSDLFVSGELIKVYCSDIKDCWKFQVLLLARRKYKRNIFVNIQSTSISIRKRSLNDQMRAK